MRVLKLLYNLFFLLKIKNLGSLEISYLRENLREVRYYNKGTLSLVKVEDALNTNIYASFRTCNKIPNRLCKLSELTDLYVLYSNPCTYLEHEVYFSIMFFLEHSI